VVGKLVELVVVEEAAAVVAAMVGELGGGG
jgi:hypothetical protein